MHFATTFRQRIHEIYDQLSQISATKAAQKPAPDKWSSIQIMGHLIDSANNNHRRFTKAQWQDNMIFNGYAQAEWVEVQNYQAADWQQILALWKSYNLHICYLMEKTPIEKLNRVVKEHNLDKIAMITVPADQPTSLGYFMKDYIYHIEHHFRQIEGMIEAAIVH
ncbi:MAG: DinB family protein [Saprospiraceae bacterium]